MIKRIISFLNKYKFIILIGIIIIFLFMHFYSVFSTHTDSLPTYKPTIQGVDKNGNKYAEINSKAEVNNTTMQSLVDSLKIELKNKGKVQSITQYIIKTDTVFSKIKIYIDTNSNFFLSKKDNYINIDATGNTLTKEGTITVSSIDTTTNLITYKKHLFKNNEYNVILYNKSPYNKIVEGRFISIKEKKTLASISIQIGINPFTTKLYYGIGASIPIFSIKK